MMFQAVCVSGGKLVTASFGLDALCFDQFRPLFGIALQFGITSLVAKNPEVIKSVGKGVMQKFPASEKLY